MRRKFFTLLILRHARPRMDRIRVSYPFVVFLGLLGVVALAAGLATPRLIARVQSQSAELDRLSHEHRRLQDERDRFETALADITGRLERFETDASRLASELGVDQLPSLEPGSGGFDSPSASRDKFWFEAELRALRSRTHALNESFVTLDSALDEQNRQIAATPDGMPVEGWFSHGYGWRKDPFSGKREFHRGVDIVAENRTPILAPADGVISRAGRFSGYGKSLDISHGYGFLTRYAHMSELNVKPGDSVRRGDVIGLVGSTGRSTGPHLHYEVFRDGRRVNPWKYLGR